MTAKTVCLFPDTNLFIQCNAVDQLDWSAWIQFDLIRLIVSKPVQREIDKHKSRGNDRVGKRARKTASLFRTIILGATGHAVMREASPRVTLSIEPLHNQDPDLSGQLNYDLVDDQLVGVLSAYAKSHPEADARLLSHDTTPLSLAHALGLKAEVIPEAWLLPPETTEAEKELNALKVENARLRKAEPSFEVKCSGSSGGPGEKFETTYNRYTPLSKTEVTQLVERLKTRFPMQADFTTQDPARPPLVGIGGLSWSYTEAEPEKIAKYKDETYPEWVKGCESALESCHVGLQRMQRRLLLTFRARNVGTRPASNTLITLQARGDLLIMPPLNEKESEAELKKWAPWHLPAVPRPPKGEWVLPSFPKHSGLSATESIMRMARLANPMFGDSPTLLHELHIPRVPLPRDPEGFFYRTAKPSWPVPEFGFECQIWRHESDEELFDAELHFDVAEDKVESAIVCRLQSENLSTSVTKTIPVRIEMVPTSPFSIAQEAVEALDFLKITVGKKDKE